MQCIQCISSSMVVVGHGYGQKWRPRQVALQVDASTVFIIMWWAGIICDMSRHIRFLGNSYARLLSKYHVHVQWIQMPKLSSGVLYITLRLKVLICTCKMNQTSSKYSLSSLSKMLNGVDYLCNSSCYSSCQLTIAIRFLNVKAKCREKCIGNGFKKFSILA